MQMFVKMRTGLLLTSYQFVSLSFCTLQQQIWLCVATEGPSFISAEGHILQLSQMV